MSARMICISTTKIDKIQANFRYTHTLYKIASLAKFSASLRTSHFVITSAPAAAVLLAATRLHITAPIRRALYAICPRIMFEKLKSADTKLKKEIKVYQIIRKDKRTPKMAKILLAAAIGYTLMPFDIIPDFIPIIGHLDDVIIVPALVILALKMIPKEVVDGCRARANSV